MNNRDSKTKNIWLAFHGMGFLSRYFLKPFTGLNATENYIIAPQAPSKYYLNDKYNYVGASWLTKENTQEELKNVLHYVDQLYTKEKITNQENLILFGFSQGVSIALRWMVSRKIKCRTLIIYAGGIPHELKKEDFDYIDLRKLSIKICYGNKDKFLTPERLKIEREKISALFGAHAEIIEFEGGHEVNPEILKNLV